MTLNIFPERHIVQRYNYGNLIIDEHGELVSGKALIRNQVFVERVDMRNEYLLGFCGFLCCSELQIDDFEIEFTQISFVAYDGIRTEVSRDQNVRGVIRNERAQILMDGNRPAVVDKLEHRKPKPLEIPNNVVNIFGRKKN